MNDGYTYCAINDCNGHDKLSKCCFFCKETECPDRCRRKELTFCVCLMQELKEEVESNE